MLMQSINQGNFEISLFKNNNTYLVKEIVTTRNVVTESKEFKSLDDAYMMYKDLSNKAKLYSEAKSIKGWN